MADVHPCQLQYHAIANLRCCQAADMLEIHKGDVAATIHTHIQGLAHVESVFSKLQDRWQEEMVAINAAVHAVAAGDVAKFQLVRDHLRKELNIPTIAHSLNRFDQLLFENTRDRLFPLAAVLETPTMVQYLLDAGLDSNTVDKFGWNPLHWACSFGSKLAAKALLGSNRTLLTKKDNNGLRPLDVAINPGRSDLGIELLRFMCLSYPNCSSLQLCCESGNFEILARILESEETPDLDKALLTALHHGSAKMVQLLLEAGATAHALGESFADAVRDSECPDGVEIWLKADLVAAKWRSESTHADTPDMLDQLFYIGRGPLRPSRA